MLIQRRCEYLRGDPPVGLCAQTKRFDSRSFRRTSQSPNSAREQSFLVELSNQDETRKARINYAGRDADYQGLHRSEQFREVRPGFFSEGDSPYKSEAPPQ